MMRKLLNPSAMLICGLILGAAVTLLFGDPDVFNWLINIVLFYILFIKKIPREV